MSSVLRKLRGRSFHELRVRGAQAMAAFAERRGLSQRAKLMSDEALLGRLAFDSKQFSSAEQLLDHFRQRTRPRFFPVFHNPEATISEFRRRWPDALETIVRRADQITSGHFDLLGFAGLEFGSPIDWDLEPVAGKRAPLIHWSRLNYLDAELFGDKKIVWELNRHQYFTTLGQAYWFTADERYAETFIGHLTGWMEQNPPKLGINWASSLEVGFRSIAWLWALYFFRHSPALTAERFLAVAKFLYLNGLHLETYLSTYFSPNTHLTGEALGLFYLGTMLPEFKESNRWRQTGLQILSKQLDKQVQGDGVYFEQSTYYHRYTTDFYLHLRILLSGNEQAIPKTLDLKLQQLLDHLMYIQRPDGRTPLVGDDDGGRLMKFDDRAANDFRATLATGAAVFGRGDYKFVANGPAQETLWLLGAEALAKLDAIPATVPAVQSAAFENSGYYVMRDGWGPDANYLFFDCGRHGVDNCGHAHADALSFELAANGQTFLVDPGTYTYTGSMQLRNWFRGSSAHNTLTVDDESWSKPAGPFSWQTIADAHCACWISNWRFDYILATQHRPDNFRTGIQHYREILFLKRDYWVIRDYVESFASHEMKAWFHFDSTVTPLRGKDNAIRLMGENGRQVVLQIATFGERGQWIQEPGVVSHCYGLKEAAPVFAFSVKPDGPQELMTFLVAEPAGGGAKPVVREFEALGGRAFQINAGGKHDVLLFRKTSNEEELRYIETARFSSDFEVAWLRFANERARSPEEFLLIGGTTVELDGRILLKSARRVDYLVASAEGDRFRVEPEGDLNLCVGSME